MTRLIIRKTMLVIVITGIVLVIATATLIHLIVKTAQFARL